MADDYVTISFNNDTITDSNGNTQTITGNVQVDYTTGSYAFSYTTSKGIESNGNVSGPTNGGGIAYNSATGQYSVNAGDLSVTYTSQQPSQVMFNFNDSSPADNFTGTGPATSVTCFATGTRIRTAKGDVPVEALAVGDQVVTASGEARPIRWIGHRTIDCRRHPRAHEVMPVRIAAHAFGEAKPARDLVVSPGHAICVESCGETLIPAAVLVNGSSIEQIEAERVTYWHVELETHDILLAEGLPAESYLDMGNRGFFVESGTVTLGSAPDARVATHADFCRPYHAAGPLVEAVQARLHARAATLGIGTPSDPALDRNAA